jgi:hypothetical protein
LHASAWIKTEKLASAGQARMFAIGEDGRVLAHSNLGVKPNQDWTEHHVVLNALESQIIRFYIGVWDCGSGKLWLDDVRLVEEPLVNLVRRPGCPLKVTSADGKTEYQEGKDFEPLSDPHLGTKPYRGEFDVYHWPPQLKVAKDSRIQEGQQIKISFYHAVTIYENQVPCSLTEPKVFEVVADQIERVNKLFAPRTWFLSHDEIRVAGWSQSERASGKSAGKLLAENVQRCATLIRQQTPEARLCVWSDMFDPHHNAKDKFYLVRGDLAGSWEGLSTDTIVVNWNSGAPAKSLPFFASHGHTQVLAGYYDAPPERIVPWIAEARKAGGLRGAMYTTWEGDYSDLEKFAAAAWGQK